MSKKIIVHIYVYIVWYITDYNHKFWIIYCIMLAYMQGIIEYKK